MANLFNTVLNLTQIKDNNNFNLDQRNFILKILEGTSQWSPLEILAKTTDVMQLNSLKAAIENEISNTSYFSFQNFYTNYQYINTLKDTLTDVQGALDQKNHLETFSTKETEKYDKFAKRMDTLYKQTTEIYHGTIMIPVNQALESRIGNSRGECFGYVAQWAAQILKKERPFGLNVNQKYTFKPIPYNSLLARKHPDINHLAILTKEISIYQELQTSVDDLIKKLSNPKENSDKQASTEAIEYDQNSDYAFYQSTAEMAPSLVNEAQKDPSKVYNLNILTYLGGHALGFCLIDNKYHFFDSNAGWFRFDNEKDFINWFPYYYKQRGYEAYHFNEYAISSYSLSKNPNTDLKSKESLSWTPGTIVLVTLFSPILALIIIGYLANMFIIRGFRYLGIIINDYFTLNDNQPEVEETDSINNSILVETLPKSLEALDLAVTSNDKKEKVSQAKNVLDYLDLSSRDNFKKSATHSFFKEPTLEKANIEAKVYVPQCKI